MAKTTTLVCEYCKKEFERSIGEANRSKKLGRRSYCSQSCQISHNNTLSPRGTTKHLRPNNKRDQFTPFRWFVLRAKARDEDTDLTVEYLEALWEEQQGTCPLSGAKLKLPHSVNGWPDGKNWYNASIDRVDNSIRYRRGNVRFISVMANLGRSVFSDSELIEFCQAIVENKGESNE